MTPAEGFAAPFSAIARRAGVGQGSLYRHPDEDRARRSRRRR
ncbi:TetR family transcriptional regulator [Microbacterium halotolerans]